MKLGKLLLLVAVVVVGLVAWSKYSKQPRVEQPAAAQKDEQQQQKEKDKPRLEEKYGFTSEGFSP